MAINGVIKVFDAETGKFKRYENANGKTVAQLNSKGVLKCTPLGIQQGFVIQDGRLVSYSNGLSPA